MKKKKVLAVLVALLLVVGAGVYTYARYTYSKAGKGEVQVAKWNVAVKNGTTEVSDDFTLGLTLDDENPNVAANRIAPNRSATATLTVDLTGTEVATDIEVKIGDVSSLPTGMTITGVTAGEHTVVEKDGVYTVALGLNGAKTGVEAETVTLKITATWANADANDSNDTEFGDGTKGTNWKLQIPVTVTAKQHIA